MTGLKAICNARKKELGVSSQDIADRSGLSASTVRNFLSGGNKSPSMHTVVLICKTLGVSLDDYFGITNEIDITGETAEPKPENDEVVELLKKGINTRNKLIFGILFFNLILLVAAIGVHVAYY